LPLACDLSAIDASQRTQHMARARHLFLEAAQERQTLPDGVAFRFVASAYPQLVAFIDNERLCCPFFHFQLDIYPAAGPIWLRIRGSDGVQEFFHSLFDQLR